MWISHEECAWIISRGWNSIFNQADILGLAQKFENASENLKLWKQQSIIQWLQEGIETQTFSHQSFSRKKVKQNFQVTRWGRVLVLRAWWDLQGGIEVFPRLVYNNKLRTQESLDWVEGKATREMNEFFSMLFTTLEVKEAIFHMGATKYLALTICLLSFFINIGIWWCRCYWDCPSKFESIHEHGTCKLFQD